MTTTHTFLLFATVATLGACTDKDIDASDDSGTAGIPTQAADDTGAMDTGDFDTGMLAANDAEDDEADPTVPEDTGVYEKDDSADGPGSASNALDKVYGAIDLGSAIGADVATGTLDWTDVPVINNWHQLCGDLPYDYPDASFWWTPPVTGAYTLSTFGSTYWEDTTLTVLEIGIDASIVACNDDSLDVDPTFPVGSWDQSPNYWHSLIEDQVLTAGAQYMLVIENKGPYTEYDLNIELVSVSDPEEPGTVDPERGE